MNNTMLPLALSTCQKVTGTAFPHPIWLEKGQPNQLTISWSGEIARIVCDGINALIRGVFLLTRAYQEGKKSLSIDQSRRIASCGAMIDCSRNAVPKVETVKQTIDRHACLGLNLLMLYTEDTYEVPEYPRLGYLRGRFSQKELQELDAYAAERGVELVPCIQTLGHMGQFLQWPENAPLRDQSDVLLIDDERTYQLIEACIRSVRACMKTNRIHIGMDEAHGVGLGRYMRQHGLVDRFDLLNRHLEKVIAICQKYDFTPMMWSDMYFRLGSANNDYYDENTCIPQSVIDQIPPVNMVYWDYYHMNEAYYEHMLTEHEKMCDNPTLAGGIWTWSGFLPAVKRTFATMIPALKACAKLHTPTVLATMWGDDGAETNYTLSEGLLPLFSEFSWQGEEVSESEIQRMGEVLTGDKNELLTAMGDLYRSPEDERTGKNLIWCDPLLPLTGPENESWEALLSRYDAAMRTLETSDKLAHRYATAVFDVAMRKAMLIRSLRERYLQKDTDYLHAVVDDILPALSDAYTELRALHKELWAQEMKRFGWEVLSTRYDGAIGRLEDVRELILNFLDGEITTIEELDEEPILPQRYSDYQHLYTSMRPF